MITLPNGAQLTAMQASAILNKYWNEAPAVWDLYDSFAPGPKDVFEPADLLAVNALNGYGGRRGPMTPMTGFWCAKRQVVEQLLGQVTKVPFEALTPPQRQASANALAAVADEIEKQAEGSSFGPVATSKLVHRMRPTLGAIWDSNVEKFYGRCGTWSVFYSQVYSDVGANEADLSAAVQVTVHPSITLIRAWDILLWMTAQTVITGLK